MKKPYNKPEVSVESLFMDAPIAANCDADFEDMQQIMDFGYFGNGVACDSEYTDGLHDTICYHSNIRNAFLS